MSHLFASVAHERLGAWEKCRDEIASAMIEANSLPSLDAVVAAVRARAAEFAEVMANPARLTLAEAPIWCAEFKSPAPPSQKRKGLAEAGRKNGG